MINLTLPFPPSVNHAWGQCGTRKYLKKSGVEFRRLVSEAVLEYGKKIDGRIAVFVALHAPTKRKYDIDNRVKALLDALQIAGVFEDDEQVDMITVIRREVIKGGACRVVITNTGSKEAKASLTQTETLWKM